MEGHWYTWRSCGDQAILGFGAVWKQVTRSCRCFVLLLGRVLLLKIPGFLDVAPVFFVLQPGSLKDPFFFPKPMPVFDSKQQTWEPQTDFNSSRFLRCASQNSGNSLPNLTISRKTQFFFVDTSFKFGGTHHPKKANDWKLNNHEALVARYLHSLGFR